MLPHYIYNGTTGERNQEECWGNESIYGEKSNNYLQTNDLQNAYNNNEYLRIDHNLTAQTSEHIEIFNPRAFPSIYKNGSPPRSCISSSLNVIPSKKKFFEKIRLPLGIIATPFMDDIPIKNLPYSKLIRCRSCSSYLNPYVRIIDENSYHCSICGKKNTIIRTAQNNSILRNKPELYYSIIDYDSFVGSSSPPKLFSQIFLIDLTLCDYIGTLCEALRNGYPNLVGDQRSSVAVIAFDEFIHTFQVVENIENVTVNHVMITDIIDPVSPFPDSGLIKFKTINHMDIILEKLSEIFEGRTSKSNCLGSALQYALNIISKHGSGRITAFLSKAPSLGVSIYDFDTERNTELDSSSLQPKTDFYRQFGMDALNKEVCVDLFYLSKEPIGLSTLLKMCQLTGGEIITVPTFEGIYQTREWLTKNISLYLSRNLRLNSVLRLRMNNSFQVQVYHGNFFVSSFQKTTHPIMHNHSTLVFQIFLEYDFPNEFPTACFQVSVLSTCPLGIPRLRVMTLSLPTSDIFEPIFEGINYSTMFTLITRMAISCCFENSLSDTRKSIVNAIVDMITSFNKFNMNLSSTSSPLVPFPIYQMSVLLFALYKYDPLNPYKPMPFDRRVSKLLALKVWTTDFLLTCLHPTLYCFSDLISNVNLDDQNFTFNIKAYSLSPSFEYIQQDKIYILDSGFYIHVFITPNVPSQLLEYIFDVKDYNSLPDVMLSLPSTSNPYNIFLNHLIQIINYGRPFSPNIVIFKQSSDIVLQKFSSLLVFNHVEKIGSYRDWIKIIHSQVLIM